MKPILDLQSEAITVHLNDGEELPQRSSVTSAHADVAAPYGIYAARDGHVAAMGSVPELGKLLGCGELAEFQEPKTWFTSRDEMKSILAEPVQTQTTTRWLGILEPADTSCADVLTWPRLVEHAGFNHEAQPKAERARAHSIWELELA